MASSRLVTATPKSFSSRRVSSLGMVSSPDCRRLQVERRRLTPARVTLGLEVARADEVQAVVQVQLELAAAVPGAKPSGGVIEQRRHLARWKPYEPLEANRAGPRLLDADGRGELRPYADELLEHLAARGMRDAPIDQIALQVGLDEIPAPRGNHCEAQCTTRRGAARSGPARIEPRRPDFWHGPGREAVEQVGGLVGEEQERGVLRSHEALGDRMGEEP